MPYPIRSSRAHSSCVHRANALLRGLYRYWKHWFRRHAPSVALDTAHSVEDMNVPGFRLHPLKGAERDRWSVWVNGNWRLTFEFRDGHAYVLDYEDYH